MRLKVGIQWWCFINAVGFNFLQWYSLTWQWKTEEKMETFTIIKYYMDFSACDLFLMMKTVILDFLA